MRASTLIPRSTSARKENRNTLLAPRQTSDEDGDAQICDGETIMKLIFKFPEWEPQNKAALLD